ncbi:hypothetical protein BDB00DRAFT_813631 [Zychaea mexicana]|uniref:uncharacterized protein n=1 Tax=Zychaea mexicana TaxID=64656 RepID=UPI0022FE5E97|nr:uncharacterized protein BDB00DRAFT_813631 [Zychaea mexicana]KAI9495512.1 hypothetical protein BDB00DRAFT_813631 [Zychaea mexicana]
MGHSIAARLGPLLSRWCPKLIHLKDHYTYCDRTENVPDIDGHNSSDDEEQQQQQNGLRYLNVFEGVGQEHIGPALLRSQNTLEYFSMEMYPDAFLESDDWSRLFHTLSFSRLRSLNLYNVDFDSTSIVTMLNQSPMLETLTLKNHIPTMSNPLSPLQQPLRLQTMLFVRTLHLDNIQPFDGLSLTTLLESFPALEKLELIDLPSTLSLPRIFGRFSRLGHLHIENVPWTYSDNDSHVPTSNDYASMPFDCNSETIAARFFRQIPACEMKLNVFHLEQDSIMPVITTRRFSYDPLLLALAKISTIKELRIDLDPDSYTDEGLLTFLRELSLRQQQQQQQQQQQITAGIESLLLRNVRSMTNLALFDALAELPCLKTLAVLSRAMPTCTEVNLSGLISMLQKSKSMTLAMFENVWLVSPADSYTQGAYDDFAPHLDDDLEVWMRQQLFHRYNVSLDDYDVSITL